jgi:hypothetical protein
MPRGCGCRPLVQPALAADNWGWTLGAPWWAASGKRAVGLGSTCRESPSPYAESGKPENWSNGTLRSTRSAHSPLVRRDWATGKPKSVAQFPGLPCHLHVAFKDINEGIAKLHD